MRNSTFSLNSKYSLERRHTPRSYVFLCLNMSFWTPGEKDTHQKLPRNGQISSLSSPELNDIIRQSMSRNRRQVFQCIILIHSYVTDWNDYTNCYKYRSYVPIATELSIRQKVIIDEPKNGFHQENAVCAALCLADARFQYGFRSSQGTVPSSYLIVNPSSWI